MAETYKTCCCIGHTKIKMADELKKEIYGFIENLIVNENVKRFLFGSRSDFDFLCYSIVTDLKEKYPFVKRINYTCKSEGVIFESKRKKWERIFSSVEKR